MVLPVTALIQVGPRCVPPLIHGGIIPDAWRKERVRPWRRSHISPKACLLPLQIAFGKSASSRKPSGWPREELRLSPHGLNVGRKLPQAKQYSEKSNKEMRRGRRKEEKGRWSWQRRDKKKRKNGRRVNAVEG